MSLVSVEAIFDGENIRLLEKPPAEGPYRVLVTFVEPVPQDALARFWSSFGAWRDDRPVEHTLQEIHEARRSRSHPPAL